MASTFRWKIFLAGILFGLQILNRPNVVVAVAGIGLALLTMRRFRLALAFALGVAIALTPVVARNAIVSKQFALVSSQGGLNFYIGNHAAATGQYVAVPGVRANIEGQAEDTRRVGRKGRWATRSRTARRLRYFATRRWRGCGTILPPPFGCSRRSSRSSSTHGTSGWTSAIPTTLDDAGSILWRPLRRSVDPRAARPGGHRLGFCEFWRFCRF